MKGRRGLKKRAEESGGASVRDGPLQGPRRVFGGEWKEGRRRRKAKTGELANQREGILKIGEKRSRSREMR